MNHLDVFNKAWGSARFTKIELDPVNINEILTEQYSCSPEFSMAKSQLWDMEVRKAYRPDLFIPSVIQPGTAVTWGQQKQGSIETFMRVSKQRLWLDQTQYGTVIENVHIDHQAQVVTFIGETHASSEQHGSFKAHDAQSIFHVQHGVIGSDYSPHNTWKIVHLTSEVDDNLTRRFQSMNHFRRLPEYVEIYLCDVIGLQLSRRF